MKTVAEKMGIKTDMKAILIGEPEDFLQALGLPQLSVVKRMQGEFDYIHFFAESEASLRKEFLELKKSLQPKGMLWISWPKKGKNESDLSMSKVIEIGYNNGLVESKAISIDEKWSALKFTFPISGKVYKNRFGKLEDAEVKNQL